MLNYVGANKDADFNSDSPSTYAGDGKIATWYDQILLNRTSKVVFFLFLTSVLIPTILYNFFYSKVLDPIPTDGYSIGYCLLPRTSRVPCGKGFANTSSDCHEQCCYDEENQRCFHRLPSRFSYIMDREWTENTAMHPRIQMEPFSRRLNINHLRLMVDEMSKTHVSFLFYDPEKLNPGQGRRIQDPDYEYDVSSPEFDLTVTSNGRRLLSTERGPLIAADNIWEIMLKLTNDTMFGLGQIPLKGHQERVLYNSAQSDNALPLIFARTNSSFHGLLLESDTPAEISILEDNQILVRTITQTNIKFHLFIGPTPKDIMKDVHHITGIPIAVEYWMLGPHYCRNNFNSPQTAIDELKEFITNSVSENMPVDSLCGAVPIVMDSAKNSDMKEFHVRGMEIVLAAGKKYLPHISPYIYYTNISNTDNSEDFIHNFHNLLLMQPESREPYVGTVNKQDEDVSVVYPDYHVDVRQLLHELLEPELNINGFIIENAWPLDQKNKTFTDAYMQLPYFNENFELHFQKTIPWNTRHTNSNDTLHMYLHNSYGNLFANQINRAYNNTIVWSSSSWMDTRKAQYTQNIDASWTNFRSELMKAALGSITGHWLWSTPVCGDTDNFDKESQMELCIKWYLAASYLPLFSIYSAQTEKDPLAFTGMDKIYMMTAIRQRVSLLPYFYTVLQDDPLIRPMFFQYPDSNYLHDLYSQFNVGDALLVIPNLLPNQPLVNIWMPPGTWYEMWGGVKINGEEGATISMNTITADIVTLIRGGEIIILQEDVKSSAEETRKLSDYTVLIALDCKNFTSEFSKSRTLINGNTNDKETEECLATGKFFISKYLTLLFHATKEALTIVSNGNDWDTFCSNNSDWANNLSTIKIYGLDTNQNNYDHSKIVSVSFNLCLLQTIGKSEIKFA